MCIRDRVSPRAVGSPRDAQGGPSPNWFPGPVGARMPQSNQLTLQPRQTGPGKQRRGGETTSQGEWRRVNANHRGPP
eukprot:1196985-Alexandrium_andersonii.AAC.1